MGRVGVVVFAAVLILGIAGCGDKEKEDTGSTTTTDPILPGKANDHGTKPVADGGTLEVELDDFYFGPTFIKAKAGSKITLEVKNEGTAEHNFTIEAAEVDEDLEPGTSKTIEVTVPKQFGVPFFCEYHKAKGMQGSFITT